MHTGRVMIELDHFFILTDPGAGKADLLTDLGLIEGPGNIHAGQGTANRRFFFEDAMLELLYIHDAEEAKSGSGHRLNLLRRSTQRAASPFGIIVRNESWDPAPPYPGWEYPAEYLEPGKFLYIGENSDVLEEPLCVHLPFKPSGNTARISQRKPFSNVTDMRISLPLSHPSNVLKILANCDRISVRPNEPHLMELVFDHGAEGRTEDLRPDLPLIITF